MSDLNRGRIKKCQLVGVCGSILMVMVFIFRAASNLKGPKSRWVVTVIVIGAL